MGFLNVLKKSYPSMNHKNHSSDFFIRLIPLIFLHSKKAQLGYNYASDVLACCSVRF